MDVAAAPPANLQPPRRVRRPRRGNQNALIAWLDEQERLIRMRGIPDEVVREFDPLHNLPEPQGDDVERGRRTIEFRFTENLEGSIADQIQAKIVGRKLSCGTLKRLIARWTTFNETTGLLPGSKHWQRHRTGSDSRKSCGWKTGKRPTPNGPT